MNHFDIDQIESFISSFIESNEPRVASVMAGLNSEATPAHLVTAYSQFGDDFVEALTAGADDFMGVDGQEKPDKIGNYLQTALDLISAGKNIREAILNKGKRPQPEPSPVQTETNPPPAPTIMGMPKPLFIMVCLVLVLIAAYVGIKVFKK